MIVSVASGKGGVGKSLVASLAVVALRRQGHEVGVLNADITGPSIPKMFGITTRPSGSKHPEGSSKGLTRFQERTVEESL